MKGTVSKVVANARANYTIARVAQNGRPLLSTCGRVPYHTFASSKRTAQSTVSTGSFYTSLLNYNTKSVVQPATETLSSSRLPREIVWLLGAPGAGKGTNSSHVAKSCGIQAPTIVMSSLLENPECKRIKDAGGMVDDATVLKALMEELSKPEYRDGAVVDGFPRTKEQAEWLSNMHASIPKTSLPPKFTFVMLSLSEATSVARQLSRGNTIKELNAVRKMSGLEALEVRTTDVNEAAARTRFRVFEEQYEAVTQLSSSKFRLAVVDADAPISDVRTRLSAALRTPTPAAPRVRTYTRPSPLFANMEGLAFA